MGDYAKKHQRCCIQASINADDRISSLPDSLLHHILSFVPINFVIETSLLARRWRYVWKTVPVIIFDVGELPEDLMTTRSEFIGHCFRRHVGKKVQRLCVSLNYYQMKNRHIRSMINFVRKREVEELDLNLIKYRDHYYSPYGFNFVVPESLFACASLKELKLAGCNLKIPSSFGFPLLKKIHFRLVILPHLDVSGCPLLEELIISWCNSDGAMIFDPVTESNANSGRLSIYAPNKKLQILQIHEHSEVEERRTELVIFAPHVVSFEISGYMRTKFNFKDFLSITTATLRINSHWHQEDDSVFKLLKLLKYLGQAKALNLSKWCIQILTIREVACTEIPQLNAQLNATSIELETTFSELGLPGLIYLLRNSCNLETLNIKTRLKDKPLRIWESLPHNCFDAIQSWEIMEDVLSLLSHLGTANVTFCVGDGYNVNTFLEDTKNEIEFIRILLKCCKKLEKVMICLTCNEGDDDMPYYFKNWPRKPHFIRLLNQKLLESPKSSENVKICLS